MENIKKLEYLKKFVDYEKKSFTLGSDDNPVATICVGNVSFEKFKKMTEAEGWNGFDITEDSDLEKMKAVVEEINDGSNFSLNCSKEIQNHPDAFDISMMRW